MRFIQMIRHLALMGATPVLGAVKNYVKYKRLCIWTFSRTPAIYALLAYASWLCNHRMPALLLIVCERYIMFLYKIGRDLHTNPYRTRKQKYIAKYGLKYSDPTTKQAPHQTEQPAAG